jgi:hypothetical protein
MQIRINIPISGQAYSNNEIIIETDNLDGKSPEEAIEEAFVYQKIVQEHFNEPTTNSPKDKDLEERLKKANECILYLKKADKKNVELVKQFISNTK